MTLRKSSASWRRDLEGLPMANDNYIKTFTAIDIEKYHKGQLSPKEMHEMEKAALEDPFLADAMEGYSVAGANAVTDIAGLKKRLADNTEETKVAPLLTTRNKFFWWRVAAMIIVIAGAGLLVYQFSSTTNKNNIAQTELNKKEEAKVIDSDKVSAPVTPVQTDTMMANNLTKQKEKIVSGNGRAASGTVSNNTNSEVAITKDSVNLVIKADNKRTNSPVTTPAKTAEVNTSSGFINNNAEKKELAKTEFKKRAENNKADKDYAKVYPATEEVASNNNAITSDKSYKITTPPQHNNFFRGRVTDANNIPVPFANITNTVDNVGTYSDAKGNFNLISTDSVLNVQVKSIGFENNTIQLRNNITSNQVVMQDDTKSLSEVVISNKKPNAAARSRDNNMKLEEPEPEDGWENYDTYLTNNLNVPDDIRTKKTSSGEVEVSFEVDKNGEPTNIKVEKSLCSKCDVEAIRLVKEGPKWKRIANKKGRTTVVISF